MRKLQVWIICFIIAICLQNIWANSAESKSKESQESGEKKDDGKIEENIVDKVTEKIVDRVEEKIPEKVPGKEEEKVPEKEEEKVPEKEEEKIPEKEEEKVPEKEENKVLEKEEEKIPEKEEDKVPEKEEGKVPEKEEDKVPEKEEEKIPEKEEEKVPEKEEDKVPDKEEEKIPEKEENKVPEKEEDKVPEKEEDKVPEKEEEKIPEKEEEKVPPKEEEKVPENKEENITEKTPEKVEEKQDDSPTEQLMKPIYDVVKNINLRAYVLQNLLEKMKTNETISERIRNTAQSIKNLIFEYGCCLDHTVNDAIKTMFHLSEKYYNLCNANMKEKIPETIALIKTCIKEQNGDENIVNEFTDKLNACVDTEMEKRSEKIMQQVANELVIVDDFLKDAPTKLISCTEIASFIGVVKNIKVYYCAGSAKSVVVAKLTVVCSKVPIITTKGEAHFRQLIGQCYNCYMKQMERIRDRLVSANINVDGCDVPEFKKLLN